MKVAFLSESPADEEALFVLVGGLLGEQIDLIDNGFQVRPGGWASTIRLAPVAVRRLYYGTDVEGFVVVVDSDLTPIHSSDHEIIGREDPKCRLCQIRASVTFAVNGLTPKPNRVPFRFAVGLAVPAIEAWHRCGEDARVCEAIWNRVMRDNERTYTKNSLKRDCYGNDHPSLDDEKKYIRSNADRLVESIPLLEQSFPGGFGTMARDIRGWLAPNS